MFDIDPDPGGNSCATSLAAKVSFLTSPQAYGQAAGPVACKETHMSWVFLVGECVYKLKKPVRFAYLDFSTLKKRHAACVAEYTLNRRLAPDVYLGVAPLTRAPDGRLAIGGQGDVVDWLVVMRRLDSSGNLEQALVEGHLTAAELRHLLATLERFYRLAPRVSVTPAALVARWRRSVAENQAALMDGRAGLPASTVRYLGGVQFRFLERCADLIATRARDRRIVDGHGDLRPEHIWIGPPLRVIDCLEFSPRLRSVDPADDLSFLSLECIRFGRRRFGDAIERRVLASTEVPEPLFLFYRCCRASIRARLAIAHLFEPAPATPAKWPHLARGYLRLAVEDAIRLEKSLD